MVQIKLCIKGTIHNRAVTFTTAMSAMNSHELLAKYAIIRNTNGTSSAAQEVYTSWAERYDKVCKVVGGRVNFVISDLMVVFGKLKNI